MNKAQELLSKIKQMFDAAPAAPTPTVFKLLDGTEIKIAIDDPAVSMLPDAGDMVTANDQPAAAGSYTLADGTVITCDATGAITTVVPPVAAAATPDLSTPEGMRKAYDKFAVGTPEERLINLETLCKALMEYSFGWQLREAAAKQSTDAAIAVYKNLVDTQAPVVAKQAAMMAEMFALMTEIVGLPAADAPGVAGKKKFSFANTEERKKTFRKFQEAAKVLNLRFQESQKAAQ